MAYTRNVPAQPIGGQIMDGNRIAVSATSGFYTNDSSGTPVISPVAVAAGVNTVLTIPQAAISVTLIPSAALNISELSAFTQFATLPANSVTTIDVAKQKFLYLQGAATVSFIFNVLD